MSNSSLISKHNDIFIIRQQMPYPLQENNAYLARADDGWAVIDLGIDIPQTRELWDEAITAAGISYGSISKIIVTHCHPDHLGAAAWMQRKTGAPVYMTVIDNEIANAFVFMKGHKYTGYDRAIRDTVARDDFGEEKTRRLIIDWCENVLPLFPEPLFIKTLYENERIILNDNTYRVKILPGHTDGQMALWCEENCTLFSGDIFAENGYLHFTDWPNTRNDKPLTDFLSSLQVIEELNPEVIYPGHGKPVFIYKDIFDKLRRRHSRLADTFAEQITEPVTVGMIYEKVFPVPQTGEFADYIHYHRVLMGETRGYLNYLVSQGRLKMADENGKLFYLPL